VLLKIVFFKLILMRINNKITSFNQMLILIRKVISFLRTLILNSLIKPFNRILIVQELSFNNIKIIFLDQTWMFSNSKTFFFTLPAMPINNSSKVYFNHSNHFKVNLALTLDFQVIVFLPKRQNMTLRFLMMMS